MVVILSNNFEVNTCNVIDWLIHYQVPYMRINNDNGEIEEISVEMDNLHEHSTHFTLKYNGKLLNSKQISAYWFRRGNLPPINSQGIDLKIFKSSKINKTIQKYLDLEYKMLLDFIHSRLESIQRKLGGRSTATVNKLKVLQVAKSLGLLIPETTISNLRSDLIKARNRNTSIITKAIDNLLVAEDYGKRMLFYTEEVDENLLNDLPETIFPSLVQKKLIKKFELRIFYLLGKFYPMAIFSQRDPQTEVDFRNYNNEKPNRTVPFILSNDLEKKLTKLMEYLNLETGSIDMVVTTSNEYVFLEVNPVGQFAQVSGPCNYQLFKRVANFLANK